MWQPLDRKWCAGSTDGSTEREQASPVRWSTGGLEVECKSGHTWSIKRLNEFEMTWLIVRAGKSCSGELLFRDIVDAYKNIFALVEMLAPHTR